MDDTANALPLVCSLCGGSLPEERRDFPWCECGWNLPPDPLSELRGWQRVIGRLSRRLGESQMRQDTRWLRANPTGALTWILLSGLMYLIGVLFALGKAALYLLFVGMALFGVAAFPQNCLIAVIPLAFSMPVLYFWRPYKAWLQRARRGRSIAEARVLEMAQGVAQRLGVATPTALALSPWPVVDAGATLHAFPALRIEREVLVGLPLLATLSVTDLKVLMGHAMVRTEGVRGLLLPSMGTVLLKIWDAFEGLSHNFPALMLGSILYLSAAGVLLYAPWFLLGAVSLNLYVVNVISTVGVLLPLALALTSAVVWLTASWYRRLYLLADQRVAKSFGRNACMQAVSKLRLVRRTFQRQWPGMASDARWGKLPDGDLYAEFRRLWDSLPEAYKELSLREVAAGYPTFIYIDPTLSDRAEALKGVRDRLTDNRRADSLMAGTGEIGTAMTKAMFGQ